MRPASVSGTLSVPRFTAELRVPETRAGYPWQRWLVLASFGLLTGFNAFLYMNFSTVTKASLRLFDVDADTLVWQYSAGLLSNTFGGAYPASTNINSRNYLITGKCCLFSCRLCGSLHAYTQAWELCLKLLRGGFDTLAW
jgi:hypothetical protein